MIIEKEFEIYYFEFEVEDLNDQKRCDCDLKRYDYDLKRYDHDLKKYDHDLLIYDNLYKNLNFNHMNFHKNLKED